MATSPEMVKRAGLSEERRETGGGLFGRQKGKKLRDEQQQLLDTLLPKLQIGGMSGDQGTGSIIRPADLFPFKPAQLILEIGFGGSEHLVFRAQEQPDAGFIGVEPFLNGVAKAVASIHRGQLENIRLHHGDAVDVLSALPDSSLDLIYLLYPDPWPKRRQRKRRFVSLPVLRAMHRVLKPDGKLLFASDIDDYLGWTLALAEQSQLFDWEAETAADWQTPYATWPSTRYEAKAYREGRKPGYLTFVRR